MIPLPHRSFFAIKKCSQDLLQDLLYSLIPILFYFGKFLKTCYRILFFIFQKICSEELSRCLSNSSGLSEKLNCFKIFKNCFSTAPMGQYDADMELDDSNPTRHPYVVRDMAHKRCNHNKRLMYKYIYCNTCSNISRVQFLFSD